MEMKRLRHLYDEVIYHLEHAPVEDDCTKEENDVYSELANLKNALEYVDILDVPSPKKKFAEAKKKLEEERKKKLLHVQNPKNSVNLREIDARIFSLSDDCNEAYISVYNDSENIDKELTKMINGSECIEDFIGMVYEGETDLSIDVYRTWND